MCSSDLVNTSGLDLPQYSTEHSAGMDVRAAIDMPVTIMPGERKLIPTGLRVQLPDGYELQMRPRSGLALKRGVTLLNSPGTIDADFRGEIGVIIINHSDEPFIIERGDRIARWFSHAMNAYAGTRPTASTKASAAMADLATLG